MKLEKFDWVLLIIVAVVVWIQLYSRDNPCKHLPDDYVEMLANTDPNWRCR